MHRITRLAVVAAALMSLVFTARPAHAVDLNCEPQPQCYLEPSELVQELTGVVHTLEGFAPFVFGTCAGWEGNYACTSHISGRTFHCTGTWAFGGTGCSH